MSNKFGGSSFDVVYIEDSAALPHDCPYCWEGYITDTQRLDFILQHKASWYPGYYKKDAACGTLCYGANRKEVEGVTMRAAIDAAIREEAAK